MDSVKIDELPKLLVDIRAKRVTSIGLQLLRLACRPTELREATWDEFNLEKGLWTIPSKRMKKN